MLTSLEICAGAGGQALGLEQAGFEHRALVEIEADFCSTLRINRPHWNVIHADLRHFDGKPYRGQIDLLAGGVPCPPFSQAGKQLGADDERNLFPEAIRLVKEIKPRAVMLENVRGLLGAVFNDYRRFIAGEVAKLGYWTDWRLLNASEFGVPQLRPRVVFVAIKEELASSFKWPEPILDRKPPTVGEALHDLMAENGWTGVRRWKDRASQACPNVI